MVNLCMNNATSLYNNSKNETSVLMLFCDVDRNSAILFAFALKRTMMKISLRRGRF